MIKQTGDSQVNKGATRNKKKQQKGKKEEEEEEEEGLKMNFHFLVPPFASLEHHNGWCDNLGNKYWGARR